MAVIVGELARVFVVSLLLLATVITFEIAAGASYVEPLHV